jgi:CHASE3 domain sensor protein
LAKKLVTWIKNKLLESTFKESEQAVTEYLASNNNRSSSSPSEQAGPVNEPISIRQDTMSMNEFRRLAAKIDQHMQQLAAQGVSEAHAIINRMLGV